MNDRVLLQYEARLLRREPNVSHNLRWIRAHQGAGQRRLGLPYSLEMETRSGSVRADPRGVVFAPMRSNIRHFWIASEIAGHRGAIPVLTNHIRQLLAALEKSMEVMLQQWGTILERSARPPVTPQFVSNTLNPLYPRMDACLLSAWQMFSQREWRHVNDRLIRMGVQSSQTRGA